MTRRTQVPLDRRLTCASRNVESKVKNIHELVKNRHGEWRGRRPHLDKGSSPGSRHQLVRIRIKKKIDAQVKGLRSDYRHGSADARPTARDGSVGHSAKSACAGKDGTPSASGRKGALVGSQFVARRYCASQHRRLPNFCSCEDLSATCQTK